MGRKFQRSFRGEERRNGSRGIDRTYSCWPSKRPLDSRLELVLQNEVHSKMTLSSNLRIPSVSTVALKSVNGKERLVADEEGGSESCIVHEGEAAENASPEDHVPVVGNVLADAVVDEAVAVDFETPDVEDAVRVPVDPAVPPIFASGLLPPNEVLSLRF